MKILQVYPYFYPAWGYGGVTRVVYEISKHLVNRGHEDGREAVRIVEMVVKKYEEKYGCRE